MPTLKWIALMGALGFTLCGALSLFMAPPPNPKALPGQSIEARLAVPERTQALLKRACYDCHSNETKWPVYSRVWPASALVFADVSQGRKAMNFSDWPVAEEDSHQARRAAGLLMASCAAMQGGIMPRKQYLLMHPEARVSKEDARQFCAWSASEVSALHKLASRQ